MVTRSRPEPDESAPAEDDLNEINRKAAEEGVAATSAESQESSET